MGEVYRARDRKLDRDVAIKILPDAFASDPDRIARFEREAKTVAALNHPNIAHVHGLEESGAVGALVMELVDGPTLADRIARGAMSIDEALPVAAQIADALEAAHDHGIVHRDLKPANIKIKDDGTVKVLDFGLAKAFDAVGSGVASSATLSPTLSLHATQAGIVLGTAAYMAPEQARGRTVDKRADIWAFGAVLFEMLTGVRPFEGDDASITLASVLKSDPDWTKLPANTPPALRQLLARCLTKEPKDRLRDIGEARVALRALRSGAEPKGGSPAAAVAEPDRSRRRLAAAVAVVLILGGIEFVALRRPVEPGPVWRVTADIGTDAFVEPTGGPVGFSIALSPDGAVMAVVARRLRGSALLYVRRLDQLNSVPLAGTDDASNPFFSPDGQWIGFFAGGKLKKISVSGGAPVTLCDAANPRGGAWNNDGTIWFQPQSGAGGKLQRVAASGGTPEAATALSEGEATQRWPQFLPGYRGILFTSSPITGNYTNASIVVQPLPNGPRKVLVRGAYFGRYVASGHLLYAQGGIMFAVPFDPQRLELIGSPVPAIQGLATAVSSGSAQLAIAGNGTAAYVPGRAGTFEVPITWIDRSGRQTPLRPTASDWSNPRFSPDGRQLAIDIYDGKQIDVWIYDWSRDALSRLTVDEGEHTMPEWTPDGRRILYRGIKPATSVTLSWRRADGAGDAQALISTQDAVYPGSWHPTGKLFAFTEVFGTTGYDVMAMPIEGDDASGWRAGKAIAIANLPALESAGAFSPDGRWIAYQSNETGRPEVFVRPFPNPGGKWQISTDGGSYPVWSKARHELLYASPDNRIMVVSYTASGDSFVADKPQLWSEVRFLPRFRGPGAGLGRPFDLHPDGNRVALATARDNEDTTKQDKVVFVFNFFDELRRIAPVKSR
jgi:serine/threonine-protein kinase